ncbi:MAG: HepT-like ribonuclease domain-containing protein [Caulobacteraceae bacterium]
MIEAAETAERFIAGREREDLDRDDQLRLALVQTVQIIGEAASKLSTKTREDIPTVPWSDIIFMRNRLVHAHFDINRDLVWRTVKDDLPPLLAALERLDLSD